MHKAKKYRDGEKKMYKKTVTAALFLSLSTTVYAHSPKRIAFVFSSFSDQNAVDPIDVNSTWRNTAATYQSLRNLGFAKENIILFYNDRKPDREDNAIPLKIEFDAQPLLEGTYAKLKQTFREKTKELTSKDEVVLTTISHGGDNGVLYPDYDDSINASQLRMLISTTQAKTATFYYACYSGTMLDKAVDHAVLVSATDRTHLSWSDRNYCSNADFFGSFVNSAADLDMNGKVSFEEAAAYTKMKWYAYKSNFLEQYILTLYKDPIGFEEENKEALIKDLATNPQIKRGTSISLEWTLEKK